MENGILIVGLILAAMASVITINVVIESKRLKKLPIDRDNDGWLYEGTPFKMKVTKKSVVKKVVKKAAKKPVKKTVKKAVKKKAVKKKR